MKVTKKAVEYSLSAKTSEFKRTKIVTSIDASKYARQFYHDDILIYESAFILLLNSTNNIIGYAKISQGGVCGTVVDPKLIAKYAIDCLARGVILVHNHPSGSVNPSREDMLMSKKTRDALRLIDVNLLDSLIITSDDYYSLTDNGDL